MRPLERRSLYPTAKNMAKDNYSLKFKDVNMIRFIIEENDAKLDLSEQVVDKALPGQGFCQMSFLRC